MRNRLLILLAMCLSGAARAAPSLEAVTTHPADNFFATGTVAEAELSAKGFAPGARCPVALEVFDFTRTNRVAALKDIAKFSGLSLAQVKKLQASMA